MYIAMLTKKEKEKKKSWLCRTGRICSEDSHQPDTRSWSKERKKKKRTEKRKPTKRERIDLLPFRLSGSLAIHPFLSLSHSSRLHQKKKAEKKTNHRRLRSWLKIQPKGHRYINHLITNRFAWASTLLLEARSDPLTGLRFPPPSLSPLLLSLVMSLVMSLYTCSWLVPT